MERSGAGERAVLELAQGGDEGAFRDLAEEYRAELHAHCYRMLGSVHDAEDALQDALLRAWRGLPGFEGRSSVRSWLYAIATNAALDLARRRSAARQSGSS
jgi:RNA polymerase sigma-70 factor (ECF subfamily)